MYKDKQEGGKRRKKMISNTVRLQQLTIAEKLCTNICTDFKVRLEGRKNKSQTVQKTLLLFVGEQRESASKRKKKKPPEKIRLSCTITMPRRSDMCLNSRTIIHQK